MNVLGTGNLFAPMRESIMTRSNKILIECRPTTPDIDVTLVSPVCITHARNFNTLKKNCQNINTANAIVISYKI